MRGAGAPRRLRPLAEVVAAVLAEAEVVAVEVVAVAVAVAEVVDSEINQT